uniref:EOG090X0FYD n=1 Tax=Megafenestra aurita TaxID=2291010 RepID=A0A4Y7NHN5_9CRUS|nr:EOG090X0FYD [Megafenestra aurita]SVE92718.1 EOG090X0FYD [Megafenestra aurita]
MGEVEFCSPTRVLFTPEELVNIDKEQLLQNWSKQENYINWMESQLSSAQIGLTPVREVEEKLRHTITLESARREHFLLMRLNSKEQEIQELIIQIQELKASQAGSCNSLHSSIVDPSINVLIQHLRKELDKAKLSLEETQNELSAWKFTPDSNTGKRLMAKCRLLYQENEELGRMISSGRLAKLEGDLALQRNFSEEMKKSQSELDEFLLELDEDVEGMQSTIYFLQQQLRQTREQLAAIQKENEILRTSVLSSDKVNGSGESIYHQRSLHLVQSPNKWDSDSSQQTSKQNNGDNICEPSGQSSAAWEQFSDLNNSENSVDNTVKSNDELLKREVDFDESECKDLRFPLNITPEIDEENDCTRNVKKGVLDPSNNRRNSVYTSPKNTNVVSCFRVKGLEIPGIPDDVESNSNVKSSPCESSGSYEVKFRGASGWVNEKQTGFMSTSKDYEEENVAKLRSSDKAIKHLGNDVKIDEAFGSDSGSTFQNSADFQNPPEHTYRDESPEDFSVGRSPVEATEKKCKLE